MGRGDVGYDLSLCQRGMDAVAPCHHERLLGINVRTPVEKPNVKDQ